ncbi:hypothetical protein [Azospirillum argentinense]
MNFNKSIPVLNITFADADNVVFAVVSNGNGHFNSFPQESC